MDSEVGPFVLGNTFPRTGRLVAAELLLLSAVRRHQQVLDRPNALHLFSERMRLAGWARAWLAEQKIGSIADVIDELKSWSDTDIAGKALRRWVGDGRTPQGHATVGTLNLGRLHEGALDDPETLLDVARTLAACYIDMVEFTPPYLNLGGT
jgi:hypothetical protein